MKKVGEQMQFQPQKPAKFIGPLSLELFLTPFISYCDILSALSLHLVLHGSKSDVKLPFF